MSASDPDPPAGDRGRLLLRIAPPLLIGLVALGGPAVLLTHLHHGIHVARDSFSYLGAASNLAHGKGWTYPYGQVGSPLTLFPPLFPTLLSGGYLLGIDELDWALWQSVLLFWGLCLICGLGVYRSTGRSLMPALGGVALAVLGMPLIVIYGGVLSETLSLPAELLALFLISAFLSTGRTRWLLGAAVATSASMLTRYAGFSLFLSGCLLLAIWPKRDIKRRVRDLAIYVGIGVPANALWALRNYARARTLTGVKAVLPPLRLGDVTEGTKVVYRWFFGEPFPGSWGLELIVLAALAALLATLILSRVGGGRRGSVKVPAASAVLLLFSAVHFLFLIAVNTFTARRPPFNDRLLAPMYLSIGLAAIMCGHAVWQGWERGRSAFRVVLAAGMVALVVTLAIGASRDAPPRLAEERQSAVLLSDLSDVLGPAAQAEPGAVIYSNTLGATWFATDRPVLELPHPCDGERPRPTYPGELSDLGQRLQNVPRLVVAFTETWGAGFGAKTCKSFSVDPLIAALTLEVVDERPGLAVLTGRP